MSDSHFCGDLLFDDLVSKADEDGVQGEGDEGLWGEEEEGVKKDGWRG